MLPLLSFGAGADAETGGALVEWFMLEVGKVVVRNGEGVLNNGPTDNVAGSAESENKEVGTSPNCEASICMSPSIPRAVLREMSICVFPCHIPSLCDVPGFCEGVMNSM